MTRREFLGFGANAVTLGTLATSCSLGVSLVMERTAHRPWPVPKEPWVLFMRWHELLFLHWPVRPELIRSLIPVGLELETFKGSAWLGIVPFRMTGVRPRYIPLPMAFSELNLRTYVRTKARSGVWFFSLDANSWLAARAALSSGLPYYDARMTGSWTAPQSTIKAFVSTRELRQRNSSRLTDRPDLCFMPPPARSITG